jgi:translocation and assembly module TamB
MSNFGKYTKDAFSGLWTSRHRLIKISLLCAGIFFLIGILLATQLPKLRSFILVKIEKLSRDELPVRILPESVQVSLFPLGTELRHVKIVPKAELQGQLDPLEIETLQFSISGWQLLQGKLRITDVILKTASITARIPATQSKSDAPLDGFFDLLAQIPVSRVELEHVALHLSFVKPQLVFNADEINLTVEKNHGGLNLEVESDLISLKTPKIAAGNSRAPGDKIPGGDPNLTPPTTSTNSAANNASGGAVTTQIALQASLEINRDHLTITGLKIRRGDTFLVASGLLSGETEKLKFDNLNVNARAEVNLEPMRSWVAETLANTSSLPRLKGHGYFDARVSRTEGKELESEFKLRTTALMVDGIFIDQLSTGGILERGVLSLPKTMVESSSGKIEIEKISLRTAEEMRFSGNLKLPKIDAHELLKNVGVKNAAVWMSLKSDGPIPCSGVLKPTFELSCKGEIRGEDFILKDRPEDKKLIAGFHLMQASGSFKVTPSMVTYEAELKAPQSRGRSKGEIGFETGFKIAYEADSLATSDLTGLAGLKIEGSARIKGTTEGDSHYGVINLALDGTDLWLEDFGLGNPHADVSYKQGMLDFKGIQGHYSVSRYNGDVRVDLHRKTIAVLGRVPFFNAADILQAFSHKFKLPVPLTGTGQAQIRVNGPFEFTKLSYDLKSSLFRGSVAGENFDQVHFDVKAKSGEVTAERAELTKGPATITLQGAGHPDGTIQAKIAGRGLRLEDTSRVANTGLSLSGLIDFDMELLGPVLAPDTTLTGHITKTAIAEQGIADSSFHMKFTHHTIEGGGAFMGDAVRGDFVVPTSKEAPFALHLTTQNWNFAPVFAAIAGPGGRKDSEGRLTANIDLSSNTGGFWNSTGEIKVSEFSLARGSLALKSATPLLLSMKNGQMQVQSCELNGENTFLKLTHNANPKSKLDLQVNGKLDMSLLAMLTPFFEDLRGVLSFAFNLRGGPNTMDVLGSAYVEKGYLKFFDFPHPLEDIRLDLLFNQKRILFNSVRAGFGGGRINGSGTMALNGSKDFPLNLNGTFEKITLTIPDKVRTSGGGSFSLTGNWFPFLLKGEYDVQQGLFSKEFSPEGGASDNIRRNYFLPEFLLKENFVPLLVDLSIDFTRGIDIKNTLVEGRVLGSVSVKGNPSKPAILGQITTDRDTKMTFKDNSFDITNSNIQFEGGTEINPKLYVAAGARVQDHDISLLIQGHASKPELLWSSVPPLAEKDIISLLALGVTDTKLDAVSSQQQQASTGMQAGTGIISNNPIGQEIKDRFGVNLQFSAGFDDTSTSAVQKIIVSRQINKKLDVSATKGLGKVGETEAKIRYRLNEKLSLVGSYVGRQNDEVSSDTSTSTTSTLDKNLNRFGLDVEFKFEFK